MVLHSMSLRFQALNAIIIKKDVRNGHFLADVIMDPYPRDGEVVLKDTDENARLFLIFQWRNMKAYSVFGGRHLRGISGILSNLARM